MNLTVLECRRFVAASATEIIKRVVKDYEIDFYIKGDREIYVNNERYDIHEGDICFRRPGQEVYSFGDYDCFIVTIDFSGTANPKNYNRNSATVIQPECNSILIKDIPPVITPHNVAKYKSLFYTLESQADLNNDEAINALVMEILFLVNADLSHRLFEENKLKPTTVESVAQYINQNYSEKITLDYLAKMAYLDRSYLVRAFKKRYGYTPIKYLIEVRLSHAEDLLLNSNMSVSEIACQCGYNNESFFIAQYKKKFSMTPSQHRNHIWNIENK